MMGRHLSFVVRSSALTLVVGGLALAAAACGSDDKTETGSSGSSGSSGSPDSGRAVVYEDSGSAPNPSNCTRPAPTCTGAVCKCSEGPNKDKACQNTESVEPRYCGTLCEICK